MRLVVRLALVVAGAALLVFLFATFVAKPYSVDTASMEPTLGCSRPTAGCTRDKDEHVIVLRILYRLRAPHRDEIAAFRAPAREQKVCGAGDTLVKRVIGLPGELVEYRDGIVRIDGAVLDEPYVQRGFRGGPTGVWKVPRGSYFMMGDNRLASCDSRVWGPVPRRELIGRVVATYWPIHRISTH